MQLLTLRDPLNQVRAAFVASAALVAVRGSVGEGAILLALLGGTLLPRLLRLPRPFEIALVIGLSLQGIGQVLGLIRPDFGWDILVHTVLTGSAGACAYMTLAGLGAIPDPRASRTESHDTGVLVGVAALGIALGALWEITEGISDELLGTSLVRSQLDTTIDLIANAMGAVAGGVGTVAWVRRNRDVVEPATLPGATSTQVAD